MNMRGKENLEKAVELFKQATEKDSTYSRAYAGLAESYLILGDWGFLPSKEAFPNAREGAKRALEIDNSLAEPDKLAKMGRNGFKRAEEYYNKELYLSRLTAIYDKAIGKFQGKL